MRTVKRAASSLWFYKKKNLLLTVLAGALFALLFLVTAVSMAARHQVTQMKQTIGSSIVVQKKVHGSFFGSIGKFYENEKEILTSHPLVRDYNLVTTISESRLLGLTPYYADKAVFDDYMQRLKEIGNYLDYFNADDNTTFFGVTNSANHALFAGGGYHLVKGSPITGADADKHVILISDVMADINGLDVGDKITIASSSITSALYFEDEVTVQGIFSFPPNEEQDSLSENARYPARHPANYSFLPETLLTSINRSAYPIEQVFVYLEDISRMDDYINEMQKQLGDSFMEAGKQYDYIYYWDKDWYAQISAPFEGLARVTGLMAIMIALGIYIILMLVCAWMLRGRKREMGILFAMGEKKGSISGQILAEELLPLLLAALLGVLAATALMEPVSERVLDQFSGEQINRELEGLRDVTNRYENGGYFSLDNDFLGAHFTIYRAPDKLYIRDSLVPIAACMAAGLAILILSLAVQIRLVLREKPSRILLSAET